MVRKVVAVVGYFGGFRNVELKDLKFGFLCDSVGKNTNQKVLEKCEDGYWFSFYRSKQRGVQILSQICVPKCSKDMINCRDSVDRVPLGVCPASVIDQYLTALASDFNCCIEDLQGDFFKSTHGKNGNKFLKVPLGKNKLCRVGIEFAQELMLPNPFAYTGHCWRRSCSTNSSDAGVNVTSLMAHMGWADPKTAIRYVQKSKQSAHQMALYLCNAQRFNLKPEDLFQLPKVVPELKSSYLPSRIELPARVDSILLSQKSASTDSFDDFSFLSSSDLPVDVSSVVSSIKPVLCQGEIHANISTASDVARSSNPGDVARSSNPGDVHSVVAEVEVDKSLVGGVSALPSVKDGNVAEVVAVVPFVQGDNQSVVRSLESYLSGFVGSISNSGVINFNIQFQSK